LPRSAGRDVSCAARGRFPFRESAEDKAERERDKADAARLEEARLLAAGHSTIKPKPPRGAPAPAVPRRPPPRGRAAVDETTRWRASATSAPAGTTLLSRPPRSRKQPLPADESDSDSDDEDGGFLEDWEIIELAERADEEAAARRAGKAAKAQPAPAAPQGRGRGAKRSAALAEYAAHADLYTALITAEFEYEVMAAEERLRVWPINRLQEEGLVLLRLRAKREADLQNAAVFRFEAWNAAAAFARAANATAATSFDGKDGAPKPGEAPRPGELPFHRMMPGDMVSAIEGDKPPPPSLQRGDDVVTGVVLERGPAWIKLAVSESAALVLGQAGPGAAFRVDMAANAVAHERMRAALQQFGKPGGMPNPPAAAASAAGFSPLQRALLGNSGSSEAAEQPPCFLPPGAAGAKAARAAAAAAASSLNPSQRTAVACSLFRTLTLWQGPPGTGKTRTLLAFIQAALAMLPKRAGPAVLACAPSNVAVDNIVEGLLGLGLFLPTADGGTRPLRVIRMGAPAKVAPALRGVTLHAMAEQHPAAQLAAELRIRARASGGGHSSEAAMLRQRAREMDAEAYRATLAAADVVASTCSGAGDDHLENMAFPFCVLDEAAQSTEPGALVPLVRAHAAVLVGDAAQLPPTILSPEVARSGLARSLPERLGRVPGLEALLLDTQYRMHPGLSFFPSGRFYGGRLKDGVSAADRKQPRGLTWPAPSGAPLAFLDVLDGAEVRVRDGNGSASNAAEARAVARLVKRLAAANDVAAADIGVITPYAAQVRSIQRALADALPAKVAADVEVRTVDGFQGREKEIIVFSTVRANPERQLGFTADARRLNVAITRARRGLIVVGHSPTLQSDANWNAWLQWVTAAGAVLPPMQAEDSRR
jgi:regulator of nonsense transcripts 1